MAQAMSEEQLQQAYNIAANDPRMDPGTWTVDGVVQESELSETTLREAVADGGRRHQGSATVSRCSRSTGSSGRQIRTAA